MRLSQQLQAKRQEIIILADRYGARNLKIFGDVLIHDYLRINNLEVIGEATKRLSEQVRQSYPNIPWKQIAGMRDVLIHDYLRINLNRVWQTVEQDLPVLKAALTALVQELEP